MLSFRRSLGVVALCASLVVAFSARADAPAAPNQVELGVRRLETLVAEARFRAAALEAPALRGRALALPPSTGSRRLLVRTELAAATAALALRQEGNARVHLHRALQLEPGLALDGAAAPKLRR